MTEPVARIRVLIAEDDDNARSLLVDLLNTLGHIVVAEVSTGREAFERAKDVVPDVVLLDVHMPDGSGIEAAEQITQTMPGVAVVLFSGDHTLTLTERDVDGDGGDRVPAEARAAARARFDDSPRGDARERVALGAAGRGVGAAGAREPQDDRAREGNPDAPHGLVGAGGVSHPAAHESGPLGADGRDRARGAGERAGVSGSGEREAASADARRRGSGIEE